MIGRVVRRLAWALAVAQLVPLCLGCSGGSSNSGTPAPTAATAPSGGQPAPPPPPPAGDSTPPTPGDAAAMAEQPTLPDSTSRRYPSFPNAITAPPDWLKKDVPFDIDQYFAAPADNAAPFYLDALFEFGAEMELCASPEDKARRERIVEDRDRRWDQIFDRLPLDFDLGERLDFSTMDRRTVDAILAEYDCGLDLLAQAQRHSSCTFETGIAYDALIPHLSAARRAVRVIRTRVIRNLSRGRLDRALEETEIAFRLSRDLRRRGSGVAMLVSASLDQELYGIAVPALLGAPCLTQRGCSRVSEILDRQEHAADLFLEGLRGEYTYVRWLLRPEAVPELRRISAIAPADPEDAENAREVSQCLDVVANLTPDGFHKEIGSLNQWYQSMTPLGSATYHARDREYSRFEKDAASGSGILAMEIPRLRTLFVRVCSTNEANRRCARCLAAIRHWEMGHSSPPSDLLTLVKAAGMSDVPIDPYSGQPLKMTTTRGQPVVYSVGMDGKDDRAQIRWNTGTQQPEGDLIFRLPPHDNKSAPEPKPAAEPKKTAPEPKAATRKWTDRSGKFSVVAELVEVKDGIVQLKKEDGKVVSLPVERLSEADQTYLKQQTGKP